MADESSEDPPRETPAARREDEHRRRNELQEKILRMDYRRVHAAFIEEALRRCGHKRVDPETEREDGR